MTFTYAPNTGNLTQRTGMFSYTENFAYDAQERLTQADNLGMTYSADGNILSKTDVGRYYYENAKPHAVTSIDNSCFLVSDSLQTIEYNSCGMVTDIHQSVGLELSVSYGPEGGREKCIFNCNGQTYKRLYFGDYEEEITSYGTKSICYLDGGVMAARGINGILSLRVSFTDNLGSITRIYNSSGLEQFNATYDAWGNQTIYKNSISFYRGYTGHEMLSDFGLINMNGRLYDPMLGRFLSTDNYVQMPYDSQNFNRYSYCLNNPLKYTDPSGEWFGLDDLLIAGVSFVVGYVSSGISSGNWGWSSVQSGLTTAAMSWIGFNTAGLATGAITSSTWKSVASTGINTIVNSMIPSINIPIGNFGLSFSPAFGFGEGGLNIGLNTGLSYSDGNWHFGVCAGMGSTYQGWYAETGYGKFSMGYGATYYNSTTIGDYIADRQIVGTGKLSWGDYSFSVSNDLFAESHKDRWRTSAVELGIGNFLIGTSVFTNWGAAESPVINGTKQIPVNDPYVGAHIFDKKDGKTYGSWRNGQVFSAPFWVGCRNGNQALRIGGSAKIVQSLTQNMVHKFMHTPYFIHYNNFKNGAFSYYGYYNPLTLWNN